MRLLVIGATGQVAHCLRDLNVIKNLDITNLGRPALDLECSNSAVDAIEQVIEDKQPDCIINTAAFTSVDEAETNEEKAYKINAQGVEIIAQLAKSHSLPLIHLSTDYVFDGLKETAYSEKDSTNPINVYGRTKLAGEHQVTHATDDYVILRTSWVFSPYGMNFVKFMQKRALIGDQVYVVDKQIGRPTDARDIAWACLEVAQKLINDSDPKLRGLFHFAGSDMVTRIEFAEKIFKISKQKNQPFARVISVDPADHHTPAKRPQNSVLNTDKFSAIYDYRAKPLMERLVSLDDPWVDTI